MISYQNRFTTLLNLRVHKLCFRSWQLPGSDGQYGPGHCSCSAGRWSCEDKAGLLGRGGCGVTLQAGDLLYNELHVGDSKKPSESFQNFYEFFRKRCPLEGRVGFWRPTVVPLTVVFTSKNVFEHPLTQAILGDQKLWAWRNLASKRINMENRQPTKAQNHLKIMVKTAKRSKPSKSSSNRSYSNHQNHHRIKTRIKIKTTPPKTDMSPKKGLGHVSFHGCVSSLCGFFLQVPRPDHSDDPHGMGFLGSSLCRWFLQQPRKRWEISNLWKKKHRRKEFFPNF